jgi:hypothetical protein
MEKTHYRGHAAGVVEKLLSLITFFAAAKKVIPPPGRRLLNKTQENRSAFAQRTGKNQRRGSPPGYQKRAQG